MQLLHNIYFICVSHLDYASIISADCNQQNSYILQKTFLQSIFRGAQKEISIDLYNEFGLDPLNGRCNKFQFIYMHKFFKENPSIYLIFFSIFEEVP